MARILVIEDNSSVREVLAYVLTREGHVVRTAPDGPSGIASARENPPEVVILDYSLPGMEGPEVLKVLKTLRPSFPVFYFTVHGDFDKPALAEADACFLKSSDFTPVIEAIARVGGREETGAPGAACGKKTIPGTCAVGA
jgi:CheY-like chemotaxis protein